MTGKLLALSFCLVVLSTAPVYSVQSDTAVPRPEYPRPQLVRSDWLNLNGPWEFELDPGL